tara:strand:- start:608 stop:973 length:366 start_codon:yes stop_codon:yes gene_type:complete
LLVVQPGVHSLDGGLELRFRKLADGRLFSMQVAVPTVLKQPVEDDAAKAMVEPYRRCISGRQGVVDQLFVFGKEGFPRHGVLKKLDVYRCLERLKVEQEWHFACVGRLAMNGKIVSTFLNG